MLNAFRSAARLMTTAWLMFGLASTQAAVPATLSYQGFLTNPSTGAPLNAAVGSPLSVTFRLYNVAAGGTALYTEVQPVTVTNGNFNVQLGAVTPLTLPFDVPYWLETAVGTETLTPRQPLSSSPYALRVATFGNNTTIASMSSGGSSGTCILGEVRLMAGVLYTGDMVRAEGQLLPINTYQALFSLMGTMYGGNGTTNFAVPDLRAAAPNGLTYMICVAGIFP